MSEENTERQWPGSPFTDEEIKARIAASSEKGAADFMVRGGFSNANSYYFSFVDPDLPEGSRWIGGCYIRADSFDEALFLSHVMEINPGGELMAAGPAPVVALKEEYTHRLLKTREDIYEAIDENKL